MFIPLVDDLGNRLSISIQRIARKICVTLLALAAISVPKLFNAIYEIWVTGLSLTLKSRAIYLRHHVEVLVVAEVPFFSSFPFLKIFWAFSDFRVFFFNRYGFGLFTIMECQQSYEELRTKITTIMLPIHHASLSRLSRSKILSTV